MFYLYLVIFEENGVVIKSFPAIHAVDGAVSFILEWNDLTFVYGGDTAPIATAEIRKTYNGMLALAQDYMVFNVTKDDIRVRMSAIDEDIFPPPPLKAKNAPDTSLLVPFSDFIVEGNVPFPEVLQPIYDDINKKYGTDLKPPGDG